MSEVLLKSLVGSRVEVILTVSAFASVVVEGFLEEDDLENGFRMSVFGGNRGSSYLRFKAESVTRIQETLPGFATEVWVTGR